ncbi:MAG: putative rane protein [Candidatus Nomurabacteria bacterium]|nr:putative rane protein [Candidatus Nomurabacteria bacterium]
MKKITSFLQDTFAHWQDKGASRMGAAISYYAIFSIAPLFILLTGIVSSIFDKHTTSLAITRTLNITLGSSLAKVIQDLISTSYIASAGVLATIIGAIVLIVAALSVLAELNNDMDELWHVPSARAEPELTTTQNIMHFIKERLISLLLILLCGLLLLFSVAFTVLLSFFNGSIPALFENHLIVQVVNAIITLIMATGLFSLIYNIMPDTKLSTKEILWGAFCTAVLFLVGRFLIGWYISSFGGIKEFGAAGSIVGLLLWVYYSAQVFFIGASGTFVYSQKYGYLSRNK